MKKESKEHKDEMKAEAEHVESRADETLLSDGANEERIRAEELAMKIKLLFGFCADLIPYLDLIEKTTDSAYNKTNHAMSMAPIIGAMGGDYEEIHFEASLKAKRSDALLNLIKTLKETEDERIEFKEKMKAKKAGMADLMRIMGM